MQTVSPSLKSLSRKRQRQGMGSPVAPLITPWKGDVGHAGGGTPAAAPPPASSAASAAAATRRASRPENGAQRAEVGHRYPISEPKLSIPLRWPELPSHRPASSRGAGV